MKRATVGIDIGGTKTRLALFDEKFHVITDDKYKTHIELSQEHFLDHLDESLGLLKTKAKKKGIELVSAGIGTSGTVDQKGGTLKSSPITFLKGFSLIKHIGKKLGVPVRLDNDVHMGLYGEHQLGAARGLKNAIGVFFGTGIGAALIINNQLYYGTNAHAGDIGHYLVTAMGPLAGSEREGTLNDFASMGALAGKAAMLAARNSAPHLMATLGADVSKIRSGGLAESIAHGDKHVETMVRSRARLAGIVLSNFVDFLNPDIVVLGGGLVEAMPALFLKEVETGIRHHIVDEVKKSFSVAVTELREYAVAAGAAKMSWDTFIEVKK